MTATSLLENYGKKAGLLKEHQTVSEGLETKSNLQQEDLQELKFASKTPQLVDLLTIASITIIIEQA